MAITNSMITRTHLTVGAGIAVTGGIMFVCHTGWRLWKKLPSIVYEM